MYSNKTYRSPYPCYSPNPVPAVAQRVLGTTTAGATTNALCAQPSQLLRHASLSDRVLYLIGLISVLKDLIGPQAVRETLMPAQFESASRSNTKLIKPLEKPFPKIKCL
jgi:hypothetical protein